MDSVLKKRDRNGWSHEQKFLLSFKGANKLLDAFFVLMLEAAVTLDMTDCEMEQEILADRP